MQHPDREVQQALVRLNDALCSWERSTSRQSILILREQGGFVARSMSGKPVDPMSDDLTDDHLTRVIMQEF